MSQIINAAPRSILRGVQDLSGRPPVYEPEAIPQHLPHVFLFAERGPVIPQIGVGTGLGKIYGDETFNLRGKYATHQTLLSTVLSENANQHMVQRLLAPGAKVARFRLSLDILDNEADQYVRAVNNDLQYDDITNLPELQADTPLPIKSLAWIITPILADTFGEGTIDVTGPRTATVGATTYISKTYPIFDFEVSSAGDWGKGAGIRFSAPTINSAVSFDTRLIQEQLTTMFRMQIVERATANSTPAIIETRGGEQYLDFSLKPNAVNDRTSQELYLLNTYADNYINVNDTPPRFGTFDNIFLYQANVDLVLAELYTHERAVMNTAGFTAEEINEVIPVGGKYTINFFNAVAYNGFNYEGIRMETAVVLETISGTEMKSTVTQYALGGSDGTMTYAAFDAAVADQLIGYGDIIVKKDPESTVEKPTDFALDFDDTAYWPQSTIWDTGFTVPTKLKLAYVLGRRKDIWVAGATQVLDGATAQNTPSQESSLAITIQNALRLAPESEYYGTPACRAIVVGHSGELLSSTWRGLASMTIDLAAKVAKYMGASDGKWKAGFNFDIHPSNMVTMFKAGTVNATFKNVNVRNEDWANGLIWVQKYDRSSLFYPGIQTVYNDDTSILNTLYSIICIGELEKVCDRVWRELTGIQSLSGEQFIERSNELISKKTAGRFDGKFIIVPETYMTEYDEQRGFSWSCKINMYGANMKTVGTYSIISRRIEDYVP